MLQSVKIDNDKRSIAKFTAFIGQVSNEMQVLGQYENAVNIIIKFINETSNRIDIVSFPVLYLMRHSIELGYKFNCLGLSKYSQYFSHKILKSHNLKLLHSEFRKHFDIIYIKFPNIPIQNLYQDFEHLYKDTTKLIKYLGEDESSSFRYTKNGKDEQILKGTTIVEMLQIKNYYDNAMQMMSFIDVIEWYVQNYTH